MFRYIATAAIALLLLAVALRSRGHGETAPTTAPLTMVGQQPDVDVVAVPGGKNLTVRHRYAGSISRASLVYELEGERCTADLQTSCQRSLESGSGVRDTGYTTEVELKGVIPTGASRVRIELEDETGTKILPVATE